MNPDYSESIPKTDWSKVKFSSPEIPEGCCDGGRCGKPVQKPASYAEVAATPTIDECEDIAIEYQRAKAAWQAIREKPVDMVKEPPHYARFKIQPLDAINEWKLPFALGCVVKYIVRAPYKGTELLDLEKAEEFLRRYKAYRMAELNADEPAR